MSFDSDVADMLGDVFSTDGFGKAAVYAPPSGSVSVCTVIVDRADDSVTLRDTPVVAAQMVIEVRASELASPVKGGVFTIGSDGFKIVAAPRRDDPDGLIWTCLCNPQ